MLVAALLLVATMPTPLSIESINAQPAHPTRPVDAFFDPQRFSYTPNFHPSHVQDFLDSYPGPLKDTRFQIGDRSHSFAEVLISQTTLYSLNPRILLALLQQQSQLLTTARPEAEQLALAMGFEDRPGLYSQLHWATIELRHATRDYAIAWNESAPLPSLTFADNTQQAAAPNISLTRYALSRVLARTTTPDQLPARLTAFRHTYTWLFDDPRTPPDDWPAPADPFLILPMEEPARVTSFFDHDTPFLHQNGDLLSFWGWADHYLSYDGHTGWDYALKPPDTVLAAADGTVMFVGNSDDGCRTPSRSIIIDHGNGYRTLYWHLHSIAELEPGDSITAGTPLGVAGSSGCAFGPHLHFQVQYLGRDVDPYGWCTYHPDPWARNPAGQVSTWLWEDMPSPCGPVPPGAIAVDDTSPDFATSGAWQQGPLGYSGGAVYTTTMRTPRISANTKPWRVRPLDTPAVAAWFPTLRTGGRYKVLAYIPYYLNGLDDSQAVYYRVHHRYGDTEQEVNSERYANFWVDLGTYTFAPGERAMVVLSTLAGDSGRGMWADAVMWVPVEP